MPKNLQNVFKTSFKCVFKTSSRRLQDVFNTFSRCTAKTLIYRKICLGHRYWSGCKSSKSELFGYLETFRTAFFKILYGVTGSANKNIINSVIRKDVAAMVRKVALNLYFSDFSF